MADSHRLNLVLLLSASVKSCQNSRKTAQAVNRYACHTPLSIERMCDLLTEKQQAVMDLAVSRPGLTQGQLAKLIGLRRESVNRLLSRARKRQKAVGGASRVHPSEIKPSPREAARPCRAGF